MTYEEAQRICQDETFRLNPKLTKCHYSLGPGVLDMTEEELRAMVRELEAEIATGEPIDLAELDTGREKTTLEEFIK